MPDILNLSGNERVDLSDFSYAASTSQLAFHRAITNGLMINSTTQQLWVIQGFTASTSGQVLTVNNGQAVLAYRQGAQVSYGVVTSTAEGSASQAIDLTSLQPTSGSPSATFGVYVRFNYIPGTFASRTFWNSQGTGSEYSQTTPTRLTATWELRVEASNPGAEWLQIGSIVLAYNTNAVYTDKRPLYFEGRVDLSFNNTAGYTPSGQSSPVAWGDTTNAPNDRSSDRSTYGIRDMQTFTAAMRTCLEDIKGAGLARWYNNYVAGQTIGFAGTATAAQTAWYDTSFYAQGNSTTPYLNFSSGNSRLTYARPTNQYIFSVSGTSVINIGPNGIANGSSAALYDSLVSATTPIQISAGAAGTLTGFGLNNNTLTRSFSLAYANAYTQFGGTLTGPVLRSATDPLHFLSGSRYAGQIIADLNSTGAQWLFMNGLPSNFTTSATNQSLAFINVLNDTAVKTYALWMEPRSTTQSLYSALAHGGACYIDFYNNSNSYAKTNQFYWQNVSGSPAWSFAWTDASNNSKVVGYSSTTRVLDLSANAAVSLAPIAATTVSLQNAALTYVSPNLSDASLGTSATGNTVALVAPTSSTSPYVSGTFSGSGTQTQTVWIPLHINPGYQFITACMAVSSTVAGVSFTVSIRSGYISSINYQSSTWGNGSLLSGPQSSPVTTSTTSQTLTHSMAQTNPTVYSGGTWAVVNVLWNSSTAVTWYLYGVLLIGNAQTIYPLAL